MRQPPLSPHISSRQAILEVLVRGENYGVGIRNLVLERSGGAIDLGPGRLYPALRSLERDGLITSSPGETTTARVGRPRIYHRLTAEGRRAATAHREQLVNFFAFPDPSAP